ncbi:MAG: molecular chaperone DnaJ [Desertifilum sp. SIO1I2]|nr:molecular chaperone DnaJ [Desertifilum sp. SIO1I2]
MSDQTPYELLGLSEDASFDEIQAARIRLKEQHQGDGKQVEAIETAYDAVLMDRLRLRQEGKIKVPDRIRFPEKLVEPPVNQPSAPPKQLPGWLQRTLDTPSQADILWPLGVFSTLVVASALVPANLLQLVLLTGVGSSVYFLNRKERKFGRAVLLTLVGLFGGLLIGALIGQMLVGAGLISTAFVNPVSAIFTFVVMWLVSSFLR